MKRKTELILRYFHGSKRYFLCAVAASFLTTALNAVTPQIFRFGIDKVLGGRRISVSEENTSLCSSLAVGSGGRAVGDIYVPDQNLHRPAGENFARNLRDALFSPCAAASHELA